MKARVLIVDPEPASRLGLVHFIRGHPSLAVCGDAEALPVARELCEKLKPDLVLLDPAMGDGFGFIRELPRWSPASRAVVITGLSDALSVQRAFKAGALGYVLRQDPLPALLVALLGAVKGERHMGPGVEGVMLNTLACGAMELCGDAEAGLSNREREVLRLLGLGHSTRVVAEELSVSVKTVETHSQRIKEKLKLDNAAALRRHATLYAAHNGKGHSAHESRELVHA